MKKADVCDIKPSSYLTGDTLLSPLQSPVGQFYVRFKVFAAVIMKNDVSWNILQCGSVRIYRRRVSSASLE
jgi:hypothetical protein